MMTKQKKVMQLKSEGLLVIFSFQFERDKKNLPTKISNIMQWCSHVDEDIEVEERN